MPSRRARALVPLLLVATCAPALRAQVTAPRADTLRTARQRLATVVVTGARREETLRNTVVTTEVVTRAEIERTGATDVASVLTEATGIQLEGGTPTGAGVQLQGLGAQRVLILLDGQPIVGRINGNFDVARLPTSMIERIEVVKGPQSTLYGSDALGGVINIITRRPERGQRAAELSVVGGGLGRRDASLSLLRGGQRVATSLDLATRNTDLAPGLGDTDAAFARRWHAAPDLRVRVNDRWTLNAGGLVLGEAQRYRTGLQYRFADRTQAAVRAAATWRRGTHRVQPLLYLSTFDHLARTSASTVPSHVGAERDHQQLAEFELTYSGLVKQFLIDGGVETRRESIRADRVEGRTRSLARVEPYAQVTWVRGPLSLVPGVRVTWDEQWGTALAPRLAALWKPAEDLALRASVGRGFRAPDFKELHLSFVNTSVGYAVVGNPALRPEYATNISSDLSWTRDAVSARVSVFRNAFRDFIEYRQQPTGAFQLVNVGRGSTQGVESEVSIVHGELRAEAGYAFLRTRDEATGRPLLGRPAHSGRFSLSAPAGPRVRGSLTALYTGSTPVAFGPTGELAGFQPVFIRADARAVVRATSTLDLTLGVDNLLDRRLGAAWPGFTGRVVYGGVQLRTGAR